MYEYKEALNRIEELASFAINPGTTREFEQLENDYNLVMELIEKTAQ